MKKIPLEAISHMSKEEYINTLIDQQANEVDYQIQDDLLKDLVNRYVLLSKELEKSLEEIKLLSVTDPLTKVHNRLKFNQVSQEEFQRYNRYGEPFAVMMVDIDHFKKVNDNFGHDVGDETLISVAHQVKMMLRKTDHFARWGGEEFIAIIVNADKDSVIHLAERIREKIASFSYVKVEKVTISIGCSIIQKHDTLEAVIKRADKALYVAKETGRNQVVFH